MNDKEHNSGIEIVPMLSYSEMTEDEQESIKKVNKITRLLFDPKTNFPLCSCNFLISIVKDYWMKKISVLTEMQNGKS